MPITLIIVFAHDDIDMRDTGQRVSHKNGAFLWMRYKATADVLELTGNPRAKGTAHNRSIGCGGSRPRGQMRGAR